MRSFNKMFHANFHGVARMSQVRRFVLVATIFATLMLIYKLYHPDHSLVISHSIRRMSWSKPTKIWTNATTKWANATWNLSSPTTNWKNAIHNWTNGTKNWTNTTINWTKSNTVNTANNSSLSVQPTLAAPQQRRSKGLKHNDTACPIPELNPYDPEIIQYIKEGRIGECPIQYLARVEGDTLILNADDISHAEYRYIRRVDDFNSEFSNWNSLVIFQRKQVKQGRHFQ